MSQSFTPILADRFDRQWRLTQDILRGVMKGLGPVGARVTALHPLTWRIIHRELTLAETLFRRLLILLAVSMTPPALKPRQPRQISDPTPAPTRSPSKRAPLFRLTEPDDTAPYLGRSPSKTKSAQTPRFWMPGMDAPYPPLASPKPQSLAPRNTEVLIRRLDALQDALTNPGKHTARMARWIAACRAAQKHDPDYHGRASPIRFGRPPGVTQKRLSSDYSDVRRFGQNAIAAVLRPPPDTS